MDPGATNERWLNEFNKSLNIKTFLLGDQQFIRVVQKKVLAKYSPKTSSTKNLASISNLKDFKSAMRDISLVPNFTSEYRAQNVHKYMSEKLPRSQRGVLDSEDFVKSIFVLLANSLSVHDLKTYGHIDKSD